MVPVSGKIPVLPEHPGPVQPAGLAAGVVEEHPGHLFLRFPDGDDIIRGARFLSCLQGDPQLGVVGGVEPEQVPVQFPDRLDFPRLDMDPVSDVFFPGAFVPLDFHLSVGPFHQADLHHALPDGLGSQIGPAGHVTFFLIQAVDFPHQGIQVIQGNFFPFIVSGNGLQLLFRKDLGSRDFHFVQPEPQILRRLSLFRLSTFHLAGRPFFLDLPGNPLPFQILPGPVQLDPGVIVTGRPSGSTGCQDRKQEEPLTGQKAEQQTADPCISFHSRPPFLSPWTCFYVFQVSSIIFSFLFCCWNFALF